MSGNTVALGDFAEFVRGINFKPDDVVAIGTPETVACMRTKNVQSSLDLSDVWAVHESFMRREDQCLQEGDILVSSANSWNLVGKCSWIPVLPYRATFGGFVSVLRASSSKLDRRYLYRWFSSEYVQETLRSFGQKTTNISNLNIGRCERLQLPLPPLEEQRRIAAILDQAETLRTQRRQALAHLDTLTQSLFLDMFGDPVTNSKGWPVSQIGNGAKLQGGFAFKSTDYMSDGIKLVKISNVHRDSLTWDDVDQLPESYLETYKSFAMNVGDIVIALTRPIIQSLDSVKIAVVCEADVPSLLNQRVGRFVFKKMSRLEPQYLLGFCRSKAFFNAVKRFCSESLQPNMSTGQVEELDIPLPPLALQQTFATRIQAIEALKATHRTALAQLDALFASLQQRAFAGEL